ncbi:MAG TPA: hypothetical protein VEH31_44240, partial [Streptosporangiaceae bacterium]|nr:hypothetical protein [Streptosporangiaceae bacterium]
MGVALLAIGLSSRPAGSARRESAPKPSDVAALINCGWLLVLEVLVAATAVDRLITGTPQVDRGGRDGRTSQLPAGHCDRVRVHADCRDRRDRRVSGVWLGALARSPATLSGVSAPSSAVRSTIRTAASSAHSLASLLMDLVASAAARSRLSADPPWQPMRQLP